VFICSSLTNSFLQVHLGNTKRQSFTYDCINVELGKATGLLPLLVEVSVDGPNFGTAVLVVVLLLLRVVVRVVLPNGTNLDFYSEEEWGMGKPLRLCIFVILYLCIFLSLQFCNFYICTFAPLFFLPYSVVPLSFSTFVSLHFCATSLFLYFCNQKTKFFPINLFRVRILLQHLAFRTSTNRSSFLNIVHCKWFEQIMSDIFAYFLTTLYKLMRFVYAPRNGYV
jgi:hypothetical protein